MKFTSIIITLSAVSHAIAFSPGIGSAVQSLTRLSATRVAVAPKKGKSGQDDTSETSTAKKGGFSFPSFGKPESPKDSLAKGEKPVTASKGSPTKDDLKTNAKKPAKKAGLSFGRKGEKKSVAKASIKSAPKKAKPTREKEVAKPSSGTVSKQVVKIISERKANGNYVVKMVSSGGNVPSKLKR
mmetsp:Transcript_39552/g.45055  ORF Transcript_39552/g.45055 Transcript_39552/m.45055 type:complete len:184 (+) Transcript_39552:198-749(+)